MTFLEGFVCGMLVGIFCTYWFFILYAKAMTKKEKEEAIRRAKEKWEKK